MAIFHLTTKPISRTKGRSAVAASAYRSGEEVVDLRTGQAHDYTKRSGVEHVKLLFPGGGEVSRSELWNMAEGAEKRKDSRTAREIEFSLPAELSPNQRAELAEGFGFSLVQKYGIAADLAIHSPGKRGDARNFHCHLLLTTRQFADGHLGAKSELEWEDKALRAQGKPSGREQVEEIRVQWENQCNLALARSGLEGRIDRRSLKAQLAADRQELAELEKEIAADQAEVVRAKIEAEAAAKRPPQKSPELPPESIEAKTPRQSTPSGIEERYRRAKEKFREKIKAGVKAAEELPPESIEVKKSESRPQKKETEPPTKILPTLDWINAGRPAGREPWKTSTQAHDVWRKAYDWLQAMKQHSAPGVYSEKLREYSASQAAEDKAPFLKKLRDLDELIEAADAKLSAVQSDKPTFADKLAGKFSRNFRGTDKWQREIKEAQGVRDSLLIDKAKLTGDLAIIEKHSYAAEFDRKYPELAQKAQAVEKARQVAELAARETTTALTRLERQEKKMQRGLGH